ncbi:secreted protein containing DUF1593 [Rhodopirellula baltica SH28]|uniref:Secreted protein containing DUF1593 n=1 Tax=Rhodopirellula baltica SH28 TaxID=993517 RepID=K5EDN8_RHOBT|nr:DUF1593 domain-containing protein [Rhodopirellula baltica]EKK04011.1 secreted protein containing DUF1593 [Rhodopirellula baltica SH28]
MMNRLLLCLLCLGVSVMLEGDVAAQDAPVSGVSERHRVIVSTDIGGTDPDDFQSMVHLLLYADVLDIEGLISSPFGDGRTSDILRVIDCYEADYPNLRMHSAGYPTAVQLRAITKQGETERAPYAGLRKSTEGSNWIVECARREDPRPLHVLVWGGLEDLAQSLHEAPDILPKLRVHWIGGPNKKWSADAYKYLVDHHPELWMIESNSTYRGWFVGGNQSGDWGNKRFVASTVAGRGKLGDFFVRQMADIKMGDTPTVAWLLHGDPSDPSKPSWGGRFVRAWQRPTMRLDRMPVQSDQMEVFGVLELVLAIDSNAAPSKAVLVVENQRLEGHLGDDSAVHFRFCPKASKRYDFRIESDSETLDGQRGWITVVNPSPERADHPSADLPNWWTDDPAMKSSEGPHRGAKTVNRWREDYLRDFESRLNRCLP